MLLLAYLYIDGRSHEQGGRTLGIFWIWLPLMSCFLFRKPGSLGVVSQEARSNEIVINAIPLQTLMKALCEEIADLDSDALNQVLNTDSAIIDDIPKYEKQGWSTSSARGG